MFYVRMHDKFMSGWGEAQGKRNIFIIACETLAQAEAIEAAALKRSEMRRVSIRETKPREQSGDLISWRTFSDMGGSWLQFYREPEKAA